MSALDDFRAKYPQYDKVDDSTLAAGIHRKYYAKMPFADFVKKVGIKEYSPTEGMSTGAKLAAGAGKAVVDTGRGIAQLTGQESRSDVDKARQLDAPLMQTTAGKVGNIAGNIGVGATTALIPGANTVVGAALVGGALGAAQPVGTGDSRLKNAAIGALAGGAGAGVAKGVSSVAGKAVNAAEASAASPANAAVKEARTAGYLLPPSQANPTLLNRTLEGLGGKIKTAQTLSLKNQETTNGLVRKALGLTEDAPLTEETMDGLRSNAYKSGYDPIKKIGAPFKATQRFKDSVDKLDGELADVSKEFPNIAKNSAIEGLKKDLSKGSFDPAKTVFLIRKLRADGGQNLKNFSDPEKTALGLAQRRAAKSLETMVEENLRDSNPGLVKAFQDARKVIAQSHDVEKALGADGNVSAQKLAAALDRGRPLTAELKTVARFGKSFPKAAQNPSKIGGVQHFSPLDAGVGVISGAANPHMIPKIAAAMIGRPVARGLVSSKPYQQAFVNAPTGNSIAHVPLALSEQLSSMIPGAAAQPAVGVNGR